METTPPTTEPRKRGRPKGSTNKGKADKDKEAGADSGKPSKMRGSAGDKRYTAADVSYAHWKQLVPVLYDWLASHNLVWPSLSCRWGPVLERGNYKNKQRLYLSEQLPRKARCYGRREWFEEQYDDIERKKEGHVTSVFSIDWDKWEIGEKVQLGLKRLFLVEVPHGLPVDSIIKKCIHSLLY